MFSKCFFKKDLVFFKCFLKRSGVFQMFFKKTWCFPNVLKRLGFFKEMFSIFQCFSQYFISQYFSIFLNISFQIFCFQSHLKDLYFFISTFPNFHVEHILSVYPTYLSSIIAVKLLLRCSKLLPIPYLIECLFTITQKI